MTAGPPCWIISVGSAAGGDSRLRAVDGSCVDEPLRSGSTAQCGRHQVGKLVHEVKTVGENLRSGEGHFCNTCLAKRTPNSNCLDLVTM